MIHSKTTTIKLTFSKKKKFFTSYCHQLIGLLNYNFYFVFVIIFAQCETENKDIFNQKLVVDGYIEENEAARVILSKNIPLNIILNRDNIEQYYVRNAKITLCDGLNSEVLILSSAPGLVPPFVYKGQTIIGQAGKTYDLKIEYLNQI
jgi:hypothetical protein